MLGLGEAPQVILCVKQDVFAKFPQIPLHCPLQTKHRRFVLASRWSLCEMMVKNNNRNIIGSFPQLPVFVWS